MCIVCNFYEPPIKVSANYRLLAAKADRTQASVFLESLGFKGLKFKSENEDIIQFGYQSYDVQALDRLLGKPKEGIKTPSIRYKYGDQGVLAVWPGRKLVLLKNTKRKGNHKSLEIPDAVPKGPNSNLKPLPPAGTENDDANVPKTHISLHLMTEYQRAQQSEGLRLKFLHDLWSELNQTKFQGQLKKPYLKFLRKASANQMNLRGIWYPRDREMNISPRLFNATQNFFVEVVLHEMCHQAVTELSRFTMTLEEKEDDRKHRGHGKVWQQWMRKVGLNPLRLDPNENTTYMTEEEKEQNRKWLETKDTAEHKLNLKLATKLYLGKPVVVRRHDNLAYGYAVCQAVKSGNKWAVVSEYLAEHGQNYSPSLSWYINPASTIYDWPQGDETMLDHRPFLEIAGRIIRQYERKKVIRDEKRNARQVNRGLW